MANDYVTVSENLMKAMQALLMECENSRSVNRTDTIKEPAEAGNKLMAKNLINKIKNLTNMIRNLPKEEAAGHVEVGSELHNFLSSLYSMASFYSFKIADDYLAASLMTVVQDLCVECENSRAVYRIMRIHQNVIEARSYFDSFNSFFNVRDDRDDRGQQHQPPFVPGQQPFVQRQQPFQGQSGYGQRRQREEHNPERRQHQREEHHPEWRRRRSRSSDEEYHC